MKRKLIVLVVVIAFLAGFGVLLHFSQPVVDAITGATSVDTVTGATSVDTVSEATPKAKNTAQLEGNYIFCMNSAANLLKDEGIREELKHFVSGKADTLSAYTSDKIKLHIYVLETDETLVRYAESLCEQLSESGVDAELKEYSKTMLCSRIVGGKYEIFLAAENLLDVSSLEQADYIVLDSTEMR